MPPAQKPDLKELQRIEGMGPARAALIAAALEFSRRRIPEIIEKKKRWIRASQRKIEEQARFFARNSGVSLPDHLSLPAVGENWMLRYQNGQATWAAVYENGAEQLLIRGNVKDHFACQAAIKRWLARKAKAKLTPWIREIGLDNGLTFNRIFIKCQRTRWASCSRHKSISLNMKLLFLPVPLVRYVFIHELCHTLYMNHSSKYWTLLSSIEPDFIGLDKELRHAWRRVLPWVG